MAKGRQTPNELDTFYKTKFAFFKDQQLQRYKFFEERHNELLRRHLQWCKFSIDLLEREFLRILEDVGGNDAVTTSSEQFHLDDLYRHAEEQQRQLVAAKDKSLTPSQLLTSMIHPTTKETPSTNRKSQISEIEIDYYQKEEADYRENRDISYTELTTHQVDESRNEQHTPAVMGSQILDIRGGFEVRLIRPMFLLIEYRQKNKSPRKEYEGRSSQASSQSPRVETDPKGRISEATSRTSSEDGHRALRRISDNHINEDYEGEFTCVSRIFNRST